MTTRRELLLLLRTQPGITVQDLARALSLSVVAVRRHLDALSGERLVERVPASRRSGNGVGRPAAGWRLSSEGLELFPRRYDGFALDLLEDLGEEVGPAVVDAVFARRTEKVARQYEAALDGVTDPRQRALALAGLRDQAGYVTSCDTGPDGEVLLVENNCAVHRLAERHSVVCTMELVLFRRVLGADVEVTRVSHAMAGDPVCCYRICPKSSPEDGTAS